MPGHGRAGRLAGRGPGARTCAGLGEPSCPGGAACVLESGSVVGSAGAGERAGGVEGFFKELVAGSMEAERTAAVAARYGLVLVSARRSRHGLQQEAEQADPVRSAMAFKRAMVGCLVWSR